MNENEPQEEQQVQDEPQVKKYTLKRKTIPIKIEDDHGMEQDYTLIELRGDEREEMLDFMTSRTQVNHNGDVTGMKSIKGIHAKLISKSLMDSNKKFVPEKTINSWPGGLQHLLYKECQKLSSLDKLAEDTAKNA